MRFFVAGSKVFQGNFVRLVFEVSSGPDLVFNPIMSSSEDKKPVLALEMVSMMSKITEDKLTYLNYLDWSKQSAST